ncbi:hypothetical protein E8E13_004868 [Curvularia kusanoi]|uniref:DNA-directed DNA polymerase n=1 Tax=Curvularia kusanoi TaxID=90978 RepID=A0A9P4WEP3_CURKU|nr:hypothetical protein E8E13_004868 [Curvularia kusanoi]
MVYKVLKSFNTDFATIQNGFNYDLRYMAASCANIEVITDTFDERRLGNVRIGIFWGLPYCIMCVDTTQYAYKIENKVWNLVLLAHMSNCYNLPAKLDTDTMQLNSLKENNITKMITKAVIVYYLEQYEAMSMEKWVDLSAKSESDADYFEGGCVPERRPGCYKGVIVINSNSLYGSIMVEMGIFVNRCIPAATLKELLQKANVDMPTGISEPEVKDSIELPELLSGILQALISMMKQYRRDGNEVTAGCCKGGEIVKEKIVEGTVFENVGADIKGNYMSIVITSKKKYEAVMWSGKVETKGLAPVKKDTLPIVKYVMSRSLSVFNSPLTKEEMNEELVDLLSSVLGLIKDGKLSAKSQLIKKKITGQPHYVYIDTNGNEQAVLVDIGVKVINVSKNWVVGRIKMATNRVLICLDMNTFEELRDYKSSGGRILVNDESSETSMDDNGGVNMHTMSLMIRSVMCYVRRALLAVYTNQAVLEAANHSSDSNFWRSLFKPMEPVDRHYTFDDLIMDNSVLSIGDMAGEDERADVEQRKTKEEMGGLINVCYTPQSKASGRVRMLVGRVMIRIKTSKMCERAYYLLSTLSFLMEIGFRDWVVKCGGYCWQITLEDVERIVGKWKNMCEPNMLTLHVFESMNVLNISIASGVLTRPVRLNEDESVFKFEGPFVDSMSVYHSDTLRIIPFFQYTTEPRLDLALQTRIQALCRRPINGDATSVSMGEREPIIMTSFRSTIRNMSSNKGFITHPGKYVVAAFINRTSNTEDTVSISKELADSGMFSWNRYINLPADGRLRSQMDMSKVGDPDGLKFTIGKKIPQKDMPMLVNTETSKSFKPNLLVNTKNVTRGLAALFRSMIVCMSRYDSMTLFRKLQKPQGTGVLTLLDESKVSHVLPKAFVTVDGEKLSFKDTGGREIMYSYGITEVL